MSVWRPEPFHYDNQWNPWRKLLAKQPPGLPLRLDTAWPGYWRRREHVDKGVDRWIPVGIWWGFDGRLRCIVGAGVPEATGAVAEQTAMAEWGRHLEPVTWEWFDAVYKGEQWPDIDPAVAAYVEQMRQGKLLGHNEPPQSALDALLAELAEPRLKAYERIESEDQDAARHTYREHIAKLRREADKAREAEKRPHLEKCQEIDKRYRDPLATAQGWLATLQRAGDDYRTREAQRIAEENRRRIEAAQAEQQRERERQAREEQEARDADIALAHTAQPEPPPVEPSPPPVLLQEQTEVKGAYGNKATVRKVMAIAQVTDWQALAMYYLGSEAMQAFLLRAAERDVANGFTDIPGVRIEERRTTKRRTG